MQLLSQAAECCLDFFVRSTRPYAKHLMWIVHNETVAVRAATVDPARADFAPGLGRRNSARFGLCIAGPRLGCVRSLYRRSQPFGRRYSTRVCRAWRASGAERSGCGGRPSRFVIIHHPAAYRAHSWSGRACGNGCAAPDLTQRMIIRDIDIETTGTVAIGKIDVVRRHAAEVYVAPAVGEFFDCKCWRNETESIFFGPWADVERAHVMLATIRSAMDREFADFFATGTGGGNPKALAASFSKGMAHRIGERLQRFKAGRSAAAGVLARGKDLTWAFTKLLQGAKLKTAARHAPSISTVAYAAGVQAGDRVELLGCRSRHGNHRSRFRH